MAYRAEQRMNVQTLYQSAGVTIGRFTCRLADPLWAVENYIGDQHHIVFPSTTVEIRQAGTDPLLTDPNQLVLYNPGKVYSRRPVSDAGDVCTFLMITPDALADAAETVCLRLEPDLTFPHHFAPSASRTYLLARVLAVHLRRVHEVDPLLVEERLVSLVERALSDTASFFGYRLSVADRLRPHHRDLVEAVRAILADHLTEKLSLTELSKRVSWSPFHLARVFRLHMRSSIHSYRLSLRLRYCLERVLQERTALYEIASQAGFSSPSHLTGAFRHAFATSPSAARAAPHTKEALRRLDEM